MNNTDDNFKPYKLVQLYNELAKNTDIKYPLTIKDNDKIYFRMTTRYNPKTRTWLQFYFNKDGEIISFEAWCKNYSINVSENWRTQETRSYKNRLNNIAALVEELTGIRCKRYA